MGCDATAKRFGRPLIYSGALHWSMYTFVAVSILSLRKSHTLVRFCIECAFCLHVAYRLLLP
jgi:hypothetical protein